MAKVTQNVELHLALIWVHSTETFLQVVVQFVIEFDFEVRLFIEPRYDFEPQNDPWIPVFKTSRREGMIS